MEAEEKYKLVDKSYLSDQLSKWDTDWEEFTADFVNAPYTLEYRLGRLLKMKELKWAYEDKRFELQA